MESWGWGRGWVSGELGVGISSPRAELLWLVCGPQPAAPAGLRAAPDATDRKLKLTTGTRPEMWRPLLPPPCAPSLAEVRN